MKKRIVLCLLALALLSAMTGCGKEKDADPLTVTLWHVYGGEVDSPLNGLIEQFNSTIGAEQNIRVKVELVSNSGSIHKSVLAAANSDPGAPSLPDMFVSYPKTVLALPDQDMIVDYRDYFSPEELGTFIPAFMEEGQIGGRQAILPLAKSTEVLFVNRTLFDRWAATSGASYDDLKTWEGIYALAERYAADTGKCFLVNDYHFNYFQVGVESLGENFFQNDGVRFGPAFERAWEPYAHAALEGGVWLQDGYATESLRTGDTIVSVASSASVLYYSDTVTYPDNTSEQVSITSMPYPVFDGGEKLVMQRGVGMCTTKSTPEREKACSRSQYGAAAAAVASIFFEPGGWVTFEWWYEEDNGAYQEVYEGDWSLQDDMLGLRMTRTGGERFREGERAVEITGGFPVQIPTGFEDFPILNIAEGVNGELLPIQVPPSTLIYFLPAMG